MAGGQTEFERLVREVLGFVEAAFDQRERRLEPQHEVAVRGLPELFHERGAHLRFRARLVDARRLEQIACVVNMACEHELGVPDPRTDVDQLERHLEPVGEVRGVEDRGVTARETERERVG